MSTDRRLPVREVDPSQRHVAVEAIETPSGRFTPAVLAEIGAARSVPVVVGATSGVRHRMYVDGLDRTIFSLTPAGGIAALTSDLTVNGSTFQQVMRLEGKHATATTWPAAIGGFTGTRVGVGTTSYNRPCHWLIDDQYVLLNTSDYYDFGDILDLGANHMVVEFVILVGSGTAIWLNKQASGAPNNGWRLYYNAAAMLASVRSTDGVPNAQTSITMVPSNQWFYGLMCFDPTNGISLNLNGGALTADAATPVAPESVTSPGVTLRVGTGHEMGIGIAYVGVWQAPGMLDGRLQPALAASRFAAFAGLRASVAFGQATPTVKTRATPAAVPWSPASGRRSWAYVGPGWIGQAVMRDSADASRTGIGLTIEQSNSFLNSENVNAGNWTATRLTSMLPSTSVFAPCGAFRANALIANSTNNTHGISYSVVTSTAGVHRFGVLARPGYKTWLKLVTSGIAGGSQYYDLSGAGALGTSGAGVTAKSIARFYDIDGNAWYLAMMQYTGTAAAHDHDILIANSDGSDSFAGTGAVAMYVWCPSHQVGQTTYAGPVPNAATAVARAADNLRYAAAGNMNGPRGRLTVRSMEGAAIAQNINRTVVEAMTDADNAVKLRRSDLNYPVARWTTEGMIQAELTAAFGATVADLISREAELVWAPDSFAANYNGIAANDSPDTAGVPPALTTICLGANQSTAEGLGGIIESVLIKDR